MSPHRRTIAFCLGLAALTVTAFAPVVDCDFVNLDDPDYVLDNPNVLGGLTVDNVCWAFTSNHAKNWHPLTWLSLQADATLYGKRALGYHLTNLALHVANVLLLFLVLRAMTGAEWRSAAVTALFAVHPLHVESVAWVTERKDVLSGLFWLLTMAAYVRYVRRPGTFRYLTVLLTYALGLMAKPMLVTLPCVLCLLDFWPLRRLSWPQPTAPSEGPHFRRATARLLFLEKGPLFFLALASSLVTIAVQVPEAEEIFDLPLAARLGNALVSCVAYLGQVFWPFRLSVFYPHPGSAVGPGRSTAAAVVLLAVSALCLTQFRRRPYLAVGWLWYLGTLVPVLGLVQVGGQAMADRYTYVPLIGFFLLLVWGAADLSAQLRPRSVLVSLVAGLLIFCVVRTWQQVRCWRDSVALWEHAVAVHPGNSYACASLAKAYAAQGRWDEAVVSAREAVAADPRDLRHRRLLYLFLLRSGRVEEAETERRTFFRRLAVSDAPVP